jgi:glutamate racemase
LEKSDKIDAILLACTHYPVLLDKIRKFVPPTISIISQGAIVADSLADYLKRHGDFEKINAQKNGEIQFSPLIPQRILTVMLLFFW